MYSLPPKTVTAHHELALRCCFPDQDSEIDESMIYKNLGALSKALSQEAFMRMATEDQVGAFLRRFSAGRLNVNFNLETWHTKAEEKKSAGVVEDVPTSLSAAAMPTSYRMDDLDQPLPRRKGYFLAVQSARESALYQELEQIRLERLKPANEVTRSNLDLELRERTIREELLGELKDDVARREYRRRVQKFWHRSRPNSAQSGNGRQRVVCHGRLWTASSNHIARGGVLPAGVPRPITSTVMQAAVNSVVSSTSQPSRTIADRVLKEIHDDNGQDGKKWGKRHTIRRGSSIFNGLENLSQESGSGSEEKEEERCLFRRADVLAAFKLYRSEYWLKKGGGIRSLLKSGLPIAIPKDMSRAELAYRRKVEVELMFQEVAAERSALHTPTASQELTLRGFLKAVFPLAKRSDISIMMQWIKKPPDESKVVRQKKIAKPDLGLLRDLIDLFDAIDEERTGFVPIEAVEKFLSGEIVTQGENARLNLRRQARTSQRSVINAACYPTNPRAVMILNKTLEDRPEWVVSPEINSVKSVRHSTATSVCKSLEQRTGRPKSLEANMFIFRFTP